MEHPTVECKFPFNHAAFCLNSDIFHPFVFADFRRLAAKKALASSRNSFSSLKTPNFLILIFDLLT